VVAGMRIETAAAHLLRVRPVPTKETSTRRTAAGSTLAFPAFPNELALLQLEPRQSATRCPTAAIPAPAEASRHLLCAVVRPVHARPQPRHPPRPPSRC